MPDPVSEQIAELKKRLEAIENKKDGWLKTLAKWIGGIGGIVALILQFLEGCEKLHKSPELKPVVAQYLTMNYKGDDQLMQFEFDLTIENAGNENDVIQEIRGELQTFPTRAVTPIPFDPRSITLTEDTKQIPLPFPVVTQSPRVLHCLMKTKLAAISREFFDQPRKLELNVTLSGKNKKGKAEVRFCFPVTEEMVKMVRNDFSFQRQFNYPVCSD